ncbi:FAD-dependent oxidoreductase [Nocardioides dubius]|uniref:ferredoxin--NADP(+) reductase n=1 Tax=Nocardioides dubius TaxID=317019 RepID=A0ABN1U1R0_9ACTN
MAHIITRACCNDAACVPVCPVNCIHPTPDEPDYLTAEMLYIDPDSCVDCGACVDVCPVGAIHADYDLPDEFARFEAINARYFATPERRDYPAEAPSVTKRSWAPEQGAEPLRVAVIGSGPAACYAAEELLSQRGLGVQVDLFERLPVPWGLVRFGVAPDHQDTKAASAPFLRTLRRAGCRIFLNTEVGKDISLATLREQYHAVIVASGATGDRALGVPGEELAGSHSATEFVAWYNGHPDYAEHSFDLSAERAVIVGNGNVALDVARVLASDPDRLARTDIADHALEALRHSKVREVVVLARRGPLEAAYTIKELLGLTEIPDVDLVVDPDVLSSPQGWGRDGDPASSVAVHKVELLRELSTPEAGTERRIVLRFLSSPVAVEGTDRVQGLTIERNELVESDGRWVARPTGERETLETGLVLRSVGYRGREVAGLPFDAERGVLPNDGGQVLDADGATVPGVFTTGWIKRGPSGVIGSNKRCARETVSRLLDAWAAGSLPTPTRADDVTALLPDHVDLDGWKRIEAHEVSEGKASKRPRVKLVEVARMLEVARG